MNDLALSRAKGLHFGGDGGHCFSKEEVTANCAARRFRVLPHVFPTTPEQTEREAKRISALESRGWTQEKLLAAASLGWQVEP